MKVTTKFGVKALKVKPIDWLKPTRSKLQDACKRVLYQYWNGDVVGEETRMPGTLQKFDFINLNKKIIVETHGRQHFQYNKFFHKGNIMDFGESLKRDEKKRVFAEQNGFQIIEVKNDKELLQALYSLYGTPS